MMDFEELAGEPTGSPDKLEALQTAMDHATNLELTIEQMEEDLKAAKKNLQLLRTGKIPDLMQELQMSKLDWNGWTVKIDEFVSGSLPKEPAKREKAIEWINGHGGDGLIETEIAVNFTKSEHNMALDLYGKLSEDGYEPEMQSGVHTQTLHAFVREKLRNGDAVDPEVLGLYVGKVAKFAKIKEKRK